MRSSKPIALFLLLLLPGLFAGCSGGGGGGREESSNSSSTCSTPAAIALPNGSTLATVSGPNVMTLTVNGSTCSAAFNASYPNKPCVSVTICDAANGNCQTIDDILLDTGDYGLRIFQQALNSQLLTALNQSPVEVNGQPLHECVEYGDGSTVWGPVDLARLTLGSEQTPAVPVQVVGYTASVCTGTPTLSRPSDASYNGSLGLGFLVEDCGSACVSGLLGQAPLQYYTCPGNICSPAYTGTLASQVGNPVASLPTADNNGVIVSLPSVPATGAPSATGYVILGIGTEPNNGFSGVTPYGANLSGYVPNFTTTFSGTSYQGFLDTGSNGIFVTYTGEPSTGNNGAFYAPSCTLSLQAVNTGASNAPNRGAVPFQIADADSLFASSNNVFFNLGSSIPDGLFDWGIPFFLGRNVFIAIDGKPNSLAAAPFWAY